MEQKKPGVKSKVEAILFSVGRRISLDDLSKLSRSKKEEVIAALQELQKEYDEKQSSLMLAEDGDFWKFTVREHFIPMVRKIVTETELSKTVLETLAVIAFKYPILQSELIKIRTNKAYEHLAELENSGYVSRQKQGRTNLIKLTEKFFKYFDLTEENLREKFRDFESIAQAIKEKEEDVEQIKESQRKKAEELKQQDERIKKEIESLDKSGEEFKVPLEVYKSKPMELISEEFEQRGNLVVEKEKIGELEVIHETKERIGHKNERHKKINERAKFSADFVGEETQKKSEIKNEEPKIEYEEGASAPQQNFLKKKSEGIKITQEMEKAVDEKVKQMLNPEKEEK